MPCLPVNEGKFIRVMNATSAIIAADGHVHVYPAYDVIAVLRNLIQNLDRLAAAGCNRKHAPGVGVQKLAFLAESRCHDFFGRLRNRDQALIRQGLEIVGAPDPICATVALHTVGRICLVAGRQIVTRERLEMLALAMDAMIPDGLPADEVIRRVIQAGGVPVLAWSPGKWLFARGRLVRDLIASDHGRVLCLGDTTLRPTLWPEPSLMKQARARGVPVIPGSDPLPLAGEERFAGTYGFICHGAFDTVHPAAAVRQILSAHPAALMPVGVRCGAWDVARRLARLRQMRCRPAAS